MHGGVTGYLAGAVASVGIVLGCQLVAWGRLRLMLMMRKDLQPVVEGAPRLVTRLVSGRAHAAVCPLVLPLV